MLSIFASVMRLSMTIMPLSYFQNCMIKVNLRLLAPQKTEFYAESQGWDTTEFLLTIMEAFISSFSYS